jgi:hypothetical protein
MSHYLATLMRNRVYVYIKKIDKSALRKQQVSGKPAVLGTVLGMAGCVDVPW